MYTDTIAAIATALSESGISIIRVSGEEAIPVVNSIFINKFGKRNLLYVKSHTIHYGFIVRYNNNFSLTDNSSADYIEHKDNHGNFIDEVLVSVMRSPNSYTKEDIVEIHCHGGIFVTNLILENVLNAGARLAEPGEFTKRAFLNGRIDLSKAEAVMDLIHSRNEMALNSSLGQLKGDLSDKIKSLRADILYEIAFIESALDDPEHISLDGYREKLLLKIEKLIFEINQLIKSSDNGRLMKDGISTVIVGKPNAGKSSFLNILVGKERAIVTEIAGTTRDVIEESVNLSGISLNVIDTAGIRNTEDTIEKIGVDRAKEYAKNADLIVCVIDSSVEIDHIDREIFSLINGKNSIVLLNKSDKENIVDFDDIMNLIPKYSNPYIEKKNDDIYSVSCLCDNKKFNICMIHTSTKDLTCHSGIDQFEECVKDMFFHGQLKNNSEVIITNMRHKEALKNSLSSLFLVKESIENGMEEDFFSIDLMSAYSELGKIIGEEVEDDLIEEIFSKFCMGK